MCVCLIIFFFQAEDGIRDLVRSRGLGDVYKRQGQYLATCDASNAALKTAIDTLRSVRIATVIAAGNDGYTLSLIHI